MKAIQCPISGGNNTGNSAMSNGGGGGGGGGGMVAGNVGGISATGGGRISRHQRRNDVENEEVQMYITKLKELVPFMPKNRRLSKLEVIQYVIDYICELQEALEGPTLKTSNNNNNINNGNNKHQNNCTNSNGSPLRQPLGVLAPNTLVQPTSCSTQEANSSPTILDKPSPPDTRPVSC